jgi:hypothetical protein|tara:strand:+ start:422 stop:901 length:480 start_codon:yes stop_codon:yes gene_type:complete
MLNKKGVNNMINSRHITNKECVEPKNLPKGKYLLGWSRYKKEIQIPLEEDFYIGQGATLSCMLGHSHPYTVIEIKGKVGERTVKLVECIINEDDTYTNKNYEYERNCIYIKENTLTKKFNGHNSYGNPKIRNKHTGRLITQKWSVLQTGYRRSYSNPEV